jgi:hypothetical protein
MMNDNFHSRKLYTSGKFFVHIKINSIKIWYLVYPTYPTRQIVTFQVKRVDKLFSGVGFAENDRFQMLHRSLLKLDVLGVDLIGHKQ